MDEFRVLTTSSRRWPSPDAIWERLAFVLAEELPNGGTLTVVHGDCPTGGDLHTRQWCALPMGREYTVIEERHPADWDRHGRAAGPIRSQEMIDLGADLVLAAPLPGPRELSRGTWHCIDAARRAGLTVEILAPTGPRFGADGITTAQTAFDFTGRQNR